MTALTQSPDLCAHYSAVARDIFVVIGFDGVFREVGGDVEGVLGWTAEQMCERRFSHFLHPDELGLSEAEHAQLLEGGITVEFTNRYRTKKRRWRSLEWRAIGVPELELVYATARDSGVQPPKAVPPDFQESLRVVTGFLELLERRYADRLDEDGIQFVRAALSGARRMQRLQG
ncbi:MAG TPA: PAS domain-containing protein [Thermoleophilaceae bacterium]|jgi:PAS domain S-box-containing protein|nr:PAS domain-containing protein [Thermoleophilaceae bacterium]